MKNHIQLTFLAIIMAMSSCHEYDFLDEVPVDFYSPENSFVTYEDFEAAVYHLHSRFRAEFYDRSGVYQPPRIFQHGTDFCVSQEGLGVNPNYSAFTLPTSDHIYDAVWRPAYRQIYDAN